MNGMALLLWVSVITLTYHYVGYPLLLFVAGTFVNVVRDARFLISRRDRRCSTPRCVPNVAVVISAFNEQEVIESKLENTALLDYPSDRLEILLGLDAPTDRTAERVRRVRNPQLRVFHFGDRRGKLEVLRDLVQQTSADIIVFTDANTMLRPDCIRNLVRHFSDEEVGAVSGEELRFGGEGCRGESMYWRYESAVKLMESRLNCSLGANGALYAIRRELFRPRVPSFVEDFQIPLDVRFSGYRVVYDPEAVGAEEIAPGLEPQFQRRIRLGAGNYQTLFEHPQFLNPFRGLLAFAFFSHRVLRWMSPFLLILAFVTNCTLATKSVYAALFGGQLLFYAMASLGYMQRRFGRPMHICVVPLQFCLMNLAFIVGLGRYLAGRQTPAWNVTPRQSSATMATEAQPPQ